MFRHILSAAQQTVRVSSGFRIRVSCSFLLPVKCSLVPVQKKKGKNQTHQKTQQQPGTKVAFRINVFSRDSGSEVERPNATWQNLPLLGEKFHVQSEANHWGEEVRGGFWRRPFSHHQSVFTFLTFPSLNKLWNTCEQLQSWNCTASGHWCDLEKQLPMAALWCTNLYSGAWSAHASVLTVLASLAICEQGPHRPKASVWGVRSKVGLIIFKNRKTGGISDCVWDTDTNVLGLSEEGWLSALVQLGFFEAGHFGSEVSITFALLAKVGPAGKQGRGCAAGMRLLWGLLSKATKEQPWLLLCCSTSTALASPTELKCFVTMDSASVTRGTFWGWHVPLDLR